LSFNFEKRCKITVFFPNTQELSAFLPQKSTFAAHTGTIFPLLRPIILPYSTFGITDNMSYFRRIICVLLLQKCVKNVFFVTKKHFFLAQVKKKE